MIFKKLHFLYYVFFLLLAHNKTFATNLDVKNIDLSGTWTLQLKNKSIEKGACVIEIVKTKNKKKWNTDAEYPLFEVRKQEPLRGKIGKVKILSFFQKPSDKNQAYLVFYSYKFNNLFFENSFLITSINYSNESPKEKITCKDEHSKLEYVLEKLK